MAIARSAEQQVEQQLADHLEEEEVALAPA